MMAEMKEKVSHWRNPALTLAVLTLLADLALATPATRYGATFILLWLLPGLAWTRLLTGRQRRPTAEGITVGLGIGMGTVAVLTLLLHFLPGPLTLPTLLIAVNLLTFALILIPPRHSVSKRGSESRDFSSAVVHLSLVVFAAAFFRLTDLAYSEFQGDEGVVMVRAARAVLGDDAQLFYHQKGPVEVLLPIATWTLSGTINEWQARLPFSFAGTLGIVALYLLGRR